MKNMLMQDSQPHREIDSEAANSTRRRPKRPHVAIFTEMGNGHVHPILPICSALSARGYRVTCATNQRYNRVVQGAGAEPVLFQDTPVDDALRSENEQRRKTSDADVARFEFSELEWSYLSKSNADFLAQTSSFYTDHPPDLVLYNRYSIPGRILASRFDQPAIQLSPHFAYHGRSRFWEQGVARNPEEFAAYGGRLDSLFADHGLRSQENLWHTEKLNIHFVPREFQYQPQLFDDTFFFSGCLIDRPHALTWRRPQTIKPLILISGYSGLPATQVSNLQYFQIFIEALAKLECHCILSIGDRLSPDEFGQLPPNFEINRSASHLEILPHTTLFICHGGMGSSLEALYHGVPVMAIPGSPYTEEVAYRIADLKVGRWLAQQEFTAENITAVVDAMLNDSELHSHAAAIQHTFKRSGGTKATVDRIERFLQEHR